MAAANAAVLAALEKEKLKEEQLRSSQSCNYDLHKASQMTEVGSISSSQPETITESNVQQQALGKIVSNFYTITKADMEHLPVYLCDRRIILALTLELR